MVYERAALEAQLCLNSIQTSLLNVESISKKVSVARGLISGPAANANPPVVPTPTLVSQYDNRSRLEHIYRTHFQVSLIFTDALWQIAKFVGPMARREKKEAPGTRNQTHHYFPKNFYKFGRTKLCEVPCSE